MMKVTKLKGLKDGSVQGVVRYLETTSEYYAQVGSVLPDAKWLGKNADGLNDPSRDGNDDFAKLLAGFNPETGEQWAKREKKSVMGFDVTHSCAKPFSIAFALEQDPEKRQAMVEAFERANETALAFGTNELTCRTGKEGKGPRAQIEKLFVRSVMHMDSREGETSVHFHNVLVNSAVCDDGKIRALDGEQLFDMQKRVGAVFDREVAKEFQKLGFSVTRQEKQDRFGNKILNDVEWGIAGIEREAIDAFSTRRKQVLAHVERTGDDKTEAALATRASKNKELTPSEIIQQTHERVHDLHQQGLIQFQSNDDLRQQPKQEIAESSFSELVRELHRHDSQWNQNDLIELAMNHGRFTATPEKVRDWIGDMVKDGAIVDLRPDETGQPRYCTREELTMQEQNATMALVRQGETKHHLGEKAIQNAIQGVLDDERVTLSPEQERALRGVCCETGGMAVVTGQAGTGKTTFMKAVRRAYEAEGFRVLGTSTSQVATQNLADETAIQSSNATSLLKQIQEKQIQLTGKDVLVIDEAGMFGSKNFNSLAKYAGQAGAKLVLVGDSQQLQPIEAGNPFMVVCNELKDSEKTLSNIRRQNTPELLSIAKAFYDPTKTGQELVAMMKSEGCVAQTKTQQQAIAKLVGDYRANPRSENDKLILARTHQEIKAITDPIREQRKEAGELGASRILNVQVGEVKGNIEAREFCENDRVRFTQNNKKLGIANGHTGTIQAFGEKTMDVLIDGQAEAVTVPISDKENSLDYGYARTCHTAQGLGAKSVYWLGSQSGLTREMGLVAFTRTKEQFKLYASESNIEGIERGLDKFSAKESAMDLLKPHDADMSRQRIESAFARANHEQARFDIRKKAQTKIVERVQKCYQIIGDFNENTEEYRKAKEELFEDKGRVEELKKKNKNHRDHASVEARDANFLMRPFKKKHYEEIVFLTEKQDARADEKHEALKNETMKLRPANIDEWRRDMEKAQTFLENYYGDEDGKKHIETEEKRLLRANCVPEKLITLGDRLNLAIENKQAREREQLEQIERINRMKMPEIFKRLDEPFVPVPEPPTLRPRYDRGYSR